MAEAAYATGPALLGDPRLLSSILFRIFCSIFQCETQTVRGPKEPKSPRKREGPKFKKRGPVDQAGPKRFFCSLFQCFNPGPQRALFGQNNHNIGCFNHFF
jgi:hypothetical protein